MKIVQFPLQRRRSADRMKGGSSHTRKMRDPSDADYLTTDQLRVVAAAKEGNMHCMRGMAEIHESWWHRAQQKDSNLRGPKADVNFLFRRMIYWRVKAAKAGDLESMRWLSVYIARYGQDYQLTDEMTQGSSLEWQERAAEAGDRFAMKWMGDLCSDYRDIHYDQEQAEEWYQKSAAAGCLYAFHELGYRREMGIHGEKQTEEAINWYLKSAQYIYRWRSISQPEREVCIDDLIRATEMLIEHHALTEDEKDQLNDYYEKVGQYIGWDKEQTERMKQVRKARMRLNVIR